MIPINGPILITNDDGYNAPGILVLKKIAKTFSNNVWVIAPKTNQSAKSHSITINRYMLVKKNNNKEYSVEGTPVDCIILGLKKIISKENFPSLLLSGVNDGVNMGLDSYYSGTISAAREGCLNGIISVAISIENNKKKKNWNIIINFLPKILKKILETPVFDNNYYNINFPNISIKKIKGVKLVKPGLRKPGTVILAQNKINNKYYKIPSARKMHKSAKKNIDEYELNKGFITISIHKLESFENLEEDITDNYI